MISVVLMNLVEHGERRVMFSFKVASNLNTALLLVCMRDMQLLSSAHKVLKLLFQQE
jgi:hypothetical protein